MKIWKEYISAITEIDGYKSRIKSYISDRDELLNKGGQDNSPPYTKKMGKHVTFDKQLEEEVEASSFEIHDTLEPRVWNGEKLKTKIRKALMKIATDFINNLPVPVEIEDVTLTGSLANYNWSEYSDVDLHIIVNFLEMDTDRKLVKSFFDNARMKWNNTHAIQMRGYDVEIYVEDAGESHKSSGIYSVMRDEWIHKPQKYQKEINFTAARQKADDIEYQANIAANLINAGNFKSALRTVERLKKKIQNMRRVGLASHKQEFSIENIAFKILRRNDTLGMLNDLKAKAYDSMMNVNGEESEVY